MVTFFRILTRVLVVAIALTCALVTAAMMITLGLFAGEADISRRDGGLFAAVDFAFFGFLASVLIGQISGGLAALAVLISEGFAIRRMAYHLTAGAIVTAGAGSESDVAANPAQWTLLLLAGLAAGLVYHLLAGRSAGGWR